MKLEAFAPAKVNLFLHVGPAGEDGYHPICSLMTFADLGDRLALSPTRMFDFRVEGEFAQGLSSEGDNLVVRARAAVLAAAGGSHGPFRLTLTKALPLAAGLGGGSSDAAATLSLINRGLNLGLTDIALARIAEGLGSDVPACLWRRPVIAEGRGGRLRRAPHMPVLDAVLVSPRIGSCTAEVYRAFDGLGPTAPLDPPRLPQRFTTALELARFLLSCRNDLERPAIARTPGIADVLDCVRHQAESLITRLSGSGDTCFALCLDAAAAIRLAARLAHLQPGWWVRSCRLGAGSP